MAYDDNAGGYREQRQMYPATCSDCGKATEVPFQPKDGRPVYCRECYQSKRPPRRDF